MGATDQIPAGKYEMVALLWDEITSEPGKPFTFVRHRQGEIVDLNEEDARRLVLAGAVVEPGSIQRAQVEALRAQYEAALAALPPAVRAASDGVAITSEPQATAGGPVDGGSEGVPAGAGSTDGGAAAGEGEVVDESALPKHLQGMKIDDLKTYAGSNDIEIKGLTKKGELLAAIVEAESK